MRMIKFLPVFLLCKFFHWAVRIIKKWGNKYTGLQRQPHRLRIPLLSSLISFWSPSRLLWLMSQFSIWVREITLSITREGYEKNYRNAKYTYNILFICFYLTSCPYHIVIKLLCTSFDHEYGAIHDLKSISLSCDRKQ